MKKLSIKDDEFKYQSPPFEDFNRFFTDIEYLITVFANEICIDNASIQVNKCLMIDIHNRIDQRRDYYQYYHSEGKPTLMSEAKETALLCYWIIKYKPFSQKNEEMQEFYRTRNCTINETFAYFLLKTFVIDYCKDKKVDIKELFNKENRYVMTYNFMHRDISKEAFIMYVSTLIFALEL